MLEVSQEETAADNRRLQKNSWTTEDVRLLQRLAADGTPWGVIAVRLGRTIQAVKVKHVKSYWTPEQYASYREKEKARDRDRQFRDHTGQRNMTDTKSQALADRIRDREARHQAPRSLTGSIFGDPPIGFSALERRT